jgi:hypothetical protein
MLAFGCSAFGVISFIGRQQLHEATLLAKETIHEFEVTVYPHPVFGWAEAMRIVVVPLLGLFVLLRVARRLILGQGIIPSWFEANYSGVEFLRHLQWRSPTSCWLFSLLAA